MRTLPRALVVLEKGPARVAIAWMLRALGATVATAPDPFEAAARFAEGPAALVVASLSGWRRRDLGFVAAIRARAPGASIVVLVPAERRPLAALALEAGADAWLPEPVDLRELQALASRRLAPRGSGISSAGKDPAGRLAAEIAHAVNNPLQVMSLLLETGTPQGESALRVAVGREVGRIRDAVEIVAAYGRLADPIKATASLGVLLGERLLAHEGRGAVRSVGSPPKTDIEVPLDAGQVRAAIDAVLLYLAARFTSRPAPVRGIVRRVRAGGGLFAEASMRVRGVRISQDEFREAASSVLWTDERDRAGHPGLALPEAVARGHGGVLVARETEPGTVVSLRLPTG